MHGQQNIKSVIFYHTSPVVWGISKILSVLQEDVIEIYN